MCLSVVEMGYLDSGRSRDPGRLTCLPVYLSCTPFISWLAINQLQWKIRFMDQFVWLDCACILHVSADSNELWPRGLRGLMVSIVGCVRESFTWSLVICSAVNWFEWFLPSPGGFHDRMDILRWEDWLIQRNDGLKSFFGIYQNFIWNLIQTNRDPYYNLYIEIICIVF